MAEFPALPLWTDAFLSDTGHLDATETGAYLLLLMAAWRRPNNDLPDNDVELSRFARMSLYRWKNSRNRVLAFWHLADGCWRQKKLDAVRDEVKAKRVQAQGAANTRWGKTKLETSRANQDSPTQPRDANRLGALGSGDADASSPHMQPKPKPKESKKEDSDSDRSSSPAPQANGEQERIMGEWDFLSDDGSVVIRADEFRALADELPAIKNIRGVVRQSCRAWLLEFEPPRRKPALLSWLRRKNVENLQKAACKTTEASQAARKSVAADVERRRQSERALAVRERLDRESRERRKERGDDGEFEPGGSPSAPSTHGSY